MLKPILTAIAAILVSQAAAATPSVIVTGEPINNLVKVLLEDLKLSPNIRAGGIAVESTVCTTEQGGHNASCEFKINGVKKTVSKRRSAVNVYVAIFTVTGKELNAHGTGRVSIGKYRCLPAGSRRFAGLWEPDTCIFTSKDAKPELKRTHN